LIPRNLERDVDTLADRCRDRIDAVIAQLENLLSAPSMRDPKNQGIRVRRFRRALDELDLLESVAVAALHRTAESGKHRKQHRRVDQIQKDQDGLHVHHSVEGARDVGVRGIAGKELCE